MKIERFEILKVGGNGAGIRLDVFLSKRFPSWTRSFWASCIQKGGVSIKRRGHATLRATASRRLLEGDEISITVSALTNETPRVYTGPIPVLFESRDYLAVDKPAGLLSHPAGRFGTGSLVDILRERHGTLMPCGRLDRFTSGVNLFARRKEASTSFAAAADAGLVQKEYLALVEGSPTEDEGLVDAPIGRDESSPIVLKMAVVDSGRPSRTSFRVIGRGDGCSLLLVRLHTGRKHQIRLHLAHIGHPVVRDKLYGYKIDDEYFSVGRGNLFSYWPDWHGLHCYRLGLPAGLAAKEELQLRSPPSTAMAAAIKRAGITLPAETEKRP